jgi:LysR family transcriptional activator of nhaA
MALRCGFDNKEVLNLSFEKIEMTDVAMEWLNYHHLLYFWTVAHEGGLAGASRVLRLTPPTLSGQIRLLEESLGEKLFDRSGRRLVLTEVGTEVYRYADEIFALGRELMASVQGRPVHRVPRLRVGVVDVLPKLVVRRLLDPVTDTREPVIVTCYEDRYERLLAELSRHALDLVLADSPLPPGIGVRAFTHVLGETDVTVFGAPRYAELRRGFPRSLEGAPFLLPLPDSSLRRMLDAWFESVGLRPRVVGEFEDSALLKVFGGDGVGVFMAPTAVATQVRRQYGVKNIGRIPSIRERFSAISAERRLRHPAVMAICEAARTDLFRRKRS